MLFSTFHPRFAPCCLVLACCISKKKYVHGSYRVACTFDVACVHTDPYQSLIPSNEITLFILVSQRHPRRITSSAEGKQPVRLEVNDLCYFPPFMQDLRLVVLSLHVVFRKRNTFMVLTGLHVLLMLLVYILIHTKL